MTDVRCSNLAVTSIGLMPGMTTIGQSWTVGVKTRRRIVGVEQSDVYQMLAYAHAYEAARVVMLYPWHPGLPAPGIHRRWHITGTSVAFDIATVDIGQPDSVPTTVREIIQDVEPVVTSASGD